MMKTLTFKLLDSSCPASGPVLLPVDPDGEPLPGVQDVTADWTIGRLPLIHVSFIVDGHSVMIDDGKG